MATVVIVKSYSVEVTSAPLPAAAANLRVRPELSEAADQLPGRPVAVTGELVPAVTEAVETVGVPTVKPAGALQLSPIIGLLEQKSKIRPLIEVVLAGLKVTWDETAGSPDTNGLAVLI